MPATDLRVHDRNSIKASIENGKPHDGRPWFPQGDISTTIFVGKATLRGTSNLRDVCNVKETFMVLVLD